MRLIDADKLRFRHTIKCNSDTTRPYTLNCISFDEVQNAPTIKAIPINVFDKIRAEIEQVADEEQKHDEKWAIGLRYAVKIINKHRKEINE